MSDVRDSQRSYYRSQAMSAIKRIVKRIAFEGAAAQAALSTALTGTNNDLDFEAQDYGVAGNDVTVEYQAPTAASQDIAVTVEDNAIVVALGSGAGTNEVQTVTVVGSGGTFILGYKDQFTQPIPYNATTAVVQAKLRELSTINGANVTVTGVAGAWIVTFGGTLAGANIDTLLIDSSRLQPKAAPRVDISVVTPGDDSPPVNEVVKISPINAAAGTFTLTFGAQTTSALAYNVSAANMQTALRALSSINGAHCTVTGSAGGPYTLTFTGDLAAQNVGAVTANAAGLKVASVAVTTPGVAYVIDSTAADVIAAINDNVDAAALVNVANKSANDGTGLVTAMAATHLAGGKDGVGTMSDSAAVTINPAGNNNSLAFTAVEAGLPGNGIRISYVNPSPEASAALSIDTDLEEKTIVFNLATDAGTKAEGTLTSDATAPADADEVVIGNQTYVFKTALSVAPAVPNEVLIGISAATALDNLKSAINGSAGEGTTYSTGTVAHTQVDATTNTDTTQLVVAKLAGVAANAFATTETSSHLAWGDVVLAGGVDPVVTTTGDLLKTALVADTEGAALLVTAADAGGDDGSGTLTAMSQVETSGGGGESSAGMGCFVAVGDVNVAGNLFVIETLEGASATLKLGTTVDDDNLIPSLVGTTMTEGKVVDKTGLVAPLTAPVQTPHQLITNGQVIYLKPGVADLTNGTVDVACYYQSVSEGGRLAPVD